jgi:hypothetical protein
VELPSSIRKSVRDRQVVIKCEWEGNPLVPGFEQNDQCTLDRPVVVGVENDTAEVAHDPLF